MRACLKGFEGLRLGAALVATLALASCANAPRQTFDLASGAPPPARSASARLKTASVAVETPTAIELLNSDRFVIRRAGGDLAYLEDAQWADRAPRLAQAKLVATLERAGVDAVLPGEPARLRLVTELRRFEIDDARGVAVAELVARLESEQAGARRGEATFVGEAPAEHTLGPYAALALDAALSQAAERLARWAAARARGP